jgi:hypothetical protein
MAATVPFLQDELWATIGSHLDTKALGRFACASARFGVRTPFCLHGLGSSERWTLAGEAARRALERQPAYVRATLFDLRIPSELRREFQQFQRLLWEAVVYTEPLTFNRRSENLVVHDGGTVLAHLNGVEGPFGAACERKVDMMVGKHYAEFTVCQPVDIFLIGVVDDKFLPARDEAAYYCGPITNIHRMGLIEYNPRSAEDMGVWCGEDGEQLSWPRPQMDDKSLEAGDVLGLLLDLGDGSLALYQNGQRIGLPVPSGLRGPLRWACDIFGDGDDEGPAPPAIEIAGPKEPPVVSNAVVAEERRRWALDEWSYQRQVIAESAMEEGALASWFRELLPDSDGWGQRRARQQR